MSKQIINRVGETLDLTLDDLNAFQGKLKRFDKPEYDKLRNSLEKKGIIDTFNIWLNPKDKKFYILDGHFRKYALQGFKEEGYHIPPLRCNVIKAPTYKDAKEYLLLMSSTYGRVTEESLSDYAIENELDFEFLQETLDIPGIDLNFEDPSSTSVEGEDDVPEPPKIAKSKLGEIYKLGRHRLMCGDSTDAETVAKLMDGQKADMVFTDPPYGVAYEGGHNKKKRKGIENDTLEGQDLTDLFAGSLSNAQLVSHDHAAFYIWYANGKAVETFGSFSKLQLSVRAVICWYKVKSGLGAFMSQYIPNYEPCIYAFKTGCSPQWFGPTDEKTVWELKRERSNEFHPTQKPVELPERALNNSSKTGDAVLDLFGGSGSTLIACEKTNRQCFMMELDPIYIDVIISRWETFTGQTAELVSG